MSLVPTPNAIQPMTSEAIDKVRALEDQLAALPQVEIETHHALHGGMYVRTITIPSGVALTGALIRVATVLIINGDADVYIGSTTKRLRGYNVLQAGAGRKQAFYAHKDTQVTMVFPTDATTVEQAENEFTEEADRLLSRKQNRTFQGELICQEQ